MQQKRRLRGKPQMNLEIGRKLQELEIKKGIGI